MKFLSLLFPLALAQDHSYQLMLSHFLESPFAEADFGRWQQDGSAVFTKNKIVLNPEIKEAKGAIYNKNNVVLGKHHDWIVDIKVSIGNHDHVTNRGGNGVGIFYLRNLDKEELSRGVFGYSKNFDGLGIYLNTILSKFTDKSSKLKNYVQGFVNDGNKAVNFMKTSGDQNCLALIRNRPDPFSLRIKYEHPNIGVFIEKEGKFEKCFSIKDANLDYDGIWLLTASNGVSQPDLVTVE